MNNGVFDERLQKQRRQHARLRLCFDVHIDMQALAEADFFNRQKALQKFQFFAQRNKLLFAEPQRHSQKIGQQDTHVARPGGVDAGQCADGIEAVEQEVRVDLRLQRLQFRVSRENAAFQRTSLRGARLFYLQDHVVRSHGQRIKHETRREQQRRLRRKFLIESLKCVHLR